MADSEYRTFEALQLGASLLVEGLLGLGRLRKDLRQVAEPNPVCHQLQYGLCIEVARGAVSFWTPWGDIDVCDMDQRLDDKLPEIKGLMLLDCDLKNDEPATNGPDRVYAIHQAAYLILPKPQLRPTEEYLTPEQVRGRWSEISRIHRMRLQATA